MALTEQQAKQACERLMGLTVSREHKGVYRCGTVNIHTDDTQIAVVYCDGVLNPGDVAQILASAPVAIAALIDLQGMEHHITDQALRAKFVDRVYSAIDKALE